MSSSDLPISIEDTFKASISTDAICVLASTWSSTVNTSYLTDSYILFTLKMESVYKIIIFALKMMVKSGLEKIFLKFLHDYFPLPHKSAQNHKFSNKNNYLSFQNNFLDHFSPSFLGQKWYFWVQIPFLRVKPMYESFK